MRASLFGVMLWLNWQINRCDYLARLVEHRLSRHLHHQAVTPSLAAPHSSMLSFLALLFCSLLWWLSALSHGQRPQMTIKLYYATQNNWTTKNNLYFKVGLPPIIICFQIFGGFPCQYHHLFVLKAQYILIILHVKSTKLKTKIVGHLIPYSGNPEQGKWEDSNIIFTHLSNINILLCVSYCMVLLLFVLGFLSTKLPSDMM